jgi:hypothetical protein
MILVAVSSYSKKTVFPGIAALLPCLGAALVIYAGQQGQTWGGRLLSTPVLVWIGTISYALYLWHWPLLVFARVAFGDALGTAGISAIIALSVLLAALSLRYLERPFRGARGLLKRPQVFQFSAAGILFFVALGVAGVRSDGWANRYPPEVANVLFAEQDRDPRQRECLNTKPENRGCLYGQRDAEPSLVLWGDSHAAGYSVMLGELAAERGQSLLAFTMPACPPMEGWTELHQEWRETCRDFQQLAMNRILESPSLQTVILSARFRGYPLDAPDAGFKSALRDTIQRLRKHGKQVILVYPVPEPDGHLPSALAQALKAGEPLLERTQSRAEFERTFAPVTHFLDELVASEMIRAVRPSERLCDEQQCVFYRDGIVNYYDEHHLSLSGADQLKELFRPLF